MASTSVPSSSLQATSPASTSSSSGGDANGNGGGGNGGTLPSLSSSAALYLYTFLATLVLLLAVSGVIVIRSYVLRRRQREAIELAIRNGTYVPPPSKRRVDLSKKPVIHDVFLPLTLSPSKKAREKSDGEKQIDSASLSWWASVAPVAARFVNPPLSSFTQILPSPDTERHPPSSLWRRRTGLLPYTFQFPVVIPRSRLQSQNQTPAVTNPRSPPDDPRSPATKDSDSPQLSQASPEEPEKQKLQVTFLVVMPNASEKSQLVDHEGGLPYLELGTADVLAPSPSMDDRNVSPAAT